MKPAILKNLKRRDAIILGVTAGILVSGVAGVTLYRSYQDVSFINGLDVQVTVEVDGARFSVEKDGRVPRSLRGGIHEVRILSSSGEVLDEGPIDVPTGFDVVAYNVLGAAPLYKADIVYTSSQSLENNEGQVSFLGGGRLGLVERAHFIFVEPPHSITLESHSSRATRVGVNVAKGGWISTLNYLEGQQDMMKAAALARAIARAEPGDPRAFGYARRFTTLAEGVAGTLRFLRVERARKPDEADANLAYVAAMRHADRSEEARAEYQEKARQRPDVILFPLCQARVSPKEEARAIYEGLWKIHPESVLVQQGMSAFAAGEGDHAKAVAIFEKLQQSDPLYRYRLQEHAAALVALGRTPEALALVSRYASQEATADMDNAILYARIARLPGAGTLPASARAYVDVIAGKPFSEGAAAWAASLLGDSVSSSDLAKLHEDDFRRTIEIQIAAARDPKGALEKCASATPLSLSQLNGVVAALLAAEGARTGALSLAERILASREDYAVPPSAILRYVISGTEHPDLWRLDAEVRAALDFVRARQLDAEGQPSAALLEAAARGDVLQGLVSLARKAWPKVGAAAEDKGKKVVGVEKTAKGKAKADAKPAAASSPLVVLKKEKLL